MPDNPTDNGNVDADADEVEEEDDDDGRNEEDEADDGDKAEVGDNPCNDEVKLNSEAGLKDNFCAN